MCENCDCDCINDDNTEPSDVIRPQETDVLMKVFHKMCKVNPDVWFGSGVIVSITNLKGEEFTPPFMLSGEFMGELADVVKKSIVEQFKLRELLKQDELKKIREVIEIGSD